MHHALEQAFNEVAKEVHAPLPAQEEELMQNTGRWRRLTEGSLARLGRDGGHCGNCGRAQRAELKACSFWLPC